MGSSPANFAKHFSPTAASFRKLRAGPGLLKRICGWPPGGGAGEASAAGTALGNITAVLCGHLQHLRHDLDVRGGGLCAQTANEEQTPTVLWTRHSRCLCSRCPVDHARRKELRAAVRIRRCFDRSEEHTSELQSPM